MPLRIGEGPYFSGNKTIGGVLTVGGSTLDLSSDAATLRIGAANDVVLQRAAADVLAQYRGTNAQQLHLYGTRTDASNYERLLIGYFGATDLRIQQDVAGTGVARSLLINTGSSLTLQAAGSMNLTAAQVLMNTGNPRVLLIGNSNPANGNSERRLLETAGVTYTITGGFTSQRFNIFFAPIVSAGSALTITNGATVYIEGAPSVAASALITNKYSLWIDAGLPRIDSTSANGSVATVLGSVGPVGANTTVQEWLTIDINGVQRYLPCF